MDNYVTICTICGEPIAEGEEYYGIADILPALPDKRTVHICSDCGCHVTLFDLYNQGILTMANSPDSVIDADGIVLVS